MYIACDTISAAVEVLLIILGADLRPGGAFRVNGPYLPAPPIYFIFTAAPPGNLLEELETIPDITIKQEAG
jgi:hypothetical protein